MRSVGALAVFFVALIGVLCVSAQPPSVTMADIKSMERALGSFFNLSPSYGTVCNPCAQGDAIGAIVRLAFHDSFGGGGPNGLGGMNGCIDFNEPNNNGLQEIIAQLNEVWNPFASKISKADFWVVAANFAIRMATIPPPNAPPLPPDMVPSPGALCLPLRLGRKDDAVCDDRGRLPAATFSWQEMANSFIGRIGLTVKHFCAILGAHGVGRAQFKNSGFEGGWTATQSSFSNYYFRTLRRTWTNSNSTLWTNTLSSPSVIMLPVDIEPLYSPSENCPVFANFAETSGCHFNDETGDPSGAVLAYANDIKSFYSNFSAGFQTLTEFNWNGLSAI